MMKMIEKACGEYLENDSKIVLTRTEKELLLDKVEKDKII